jgi:hypothetical protein
MDSVSARAEVCFPVCRVGAETLNGPGTRRRGRNADESTA